MLTAVKGLVASKKFWITIVGTAVTTALTLAGVPHDIVMTVASLFGVNVASQGFADRGHGK